jgi:nitrogen fixation/metabolism regulation signal transduction histidine kinase
MSYKYAHWAVVWRLVVLVLLSVLIGYLFSLEAWGYSFIVFIVVCAMIFSLLYHIKSTHRKLNFFFEAVKNEDGSLSFDETNTDQNLRGLHQSLNRINASIKEIRVREARQEHLFREFMKYSASGHMVVDDEGFIHLINEAALRFLGLKNLTHLDRLKQEHPALYSLLEDLKPGHSDHLKLLVQNELKQLAFKVVHLNLADKGYRIFSINDIKSELEENELESWQKLIQVMTHEIMNTVAPISSLSQTLRSMFHENDRTISIEKLSQEEIDNTAKSLQIIEDRAEGLGAFVDNYRKLSGLPQPVFKPIELSSWLESVKLLFQSAPSAEEIKFTLENQCPKKTFLGDETLLTHVLLNLLNNAREALEDCADKQIRLLAKQTDTGLLSLQITDNGKGFTAEEAERIFVPFYTTRIHGSGIGLSLSRQIMRMHKGRIHAQSEPNVSTTFVLEL